MRALLAALLLTGCGASLGDPPAGEGAGGDDGSDRGSPLSCEHVDVLLAVDNSGSTQKEQLALIGAFPGFSSQLRDVAGLADFRVGLVDGCAQSASLHTRGMTGPCNFAGGHAWMESSSPSLVVELACVANIDSRDALCRGNDDDEQPVSTAAAALEPTWSGAGTPNAGFSRADALLVVVAITDEDEHPIPSASARQLYDRLVAAKGSSNVLFVGFGGESNCEGPYGSADDAEKLQDVTSLFAAKRRGVFWDLCGGQLDQGLRKAVAALDAACE
ncbi:MAG TPA: hypothetical protein VIV40_05275 [Kofleriaceae bacterium]